MEVINITPLEDIKNTLPGIELLRLAILRLLNKKHPFKADRNHIHHLIITKFGLIKTNLILILLITLPLTLFQFFNEYFVYIVFATVIVYFFILNFVKRIKKRNKLKYFF